MFYILGLGSNLSMISSIVTVICDEFKFLPNWLVSFVYTIIAICAGYLFVQPVSNEINLKVDSVKSKLILEVPYLAKNDHYY